jgi:hypothetical protein
LLYATSGDGCASFYFCSSSTWFVVVLVLVVVAIGDGFWRGGRRRGRRRKSDWSRPAVANPGPVVVFFAPFLLFLLLFLAPLPAVERPATSIIFYVREGHAIVIYQM